jgi:CRP-like cAMP-binding protein
VQAIPNRILLAMAPETRSFLLQHALTRPVAAGEVLYRESTPFSHAVFLNRGIISLMGERGDGSFGEKASIGREGLLGVAVMLGGENALSCSVVRVSGEATYIPMQAIREAADRFGCFRYIMMRYARSFIVQLLETVLSARLDQAQAQIADWLSMAHVRMEGEPFGLTQDSLAEALGVRRITVGSTLSMLKREGIVTYSRGLMAIRDPLRLAAYGSESHRRILDAFAWQNEPEQVFWKS